MPTGEKFRRPPKYKPVPSLTIHPLYDPIRACDICVLRDGCDGPVPGVGPERAVVMFVGEAPGENEDRYGIPFTGPTWEELATLLEIPGLSRDTIYLTNVVKCKPVGDPVLTDADPCASEWLEAEIAMVRPRILVTMGQLATRAVTGDAAAVMSEEHGIPRRQWVGQWEGWVVPVYHPAAGFYNTRLMTAIRDDFQAVKELLRGGRARGKVVDAFDGEEDYHDLREWDGKDVAYFLRGIGEAGMVAIDTETVGMARSLWCVGVSWEPGTGYLIGPHQLSLLEPWLNHPGVSVIYHNALYDIPVLQAAGAFLLNRPRQLHDTMFMARVLQLEEAGLKFLAHKLAGMAMHDYVDVVREADLVKQVGYLEKAMSVAADLPKPSPVIEVVWDKIGKQLVEKKRQPQALIRKLTRMMADVGEGKVDGAAIRKRWRDWGEETAPIVAVIGPMVEASLADVDPDAAVRYAARDPDATLRIFPILKKRLEEAGLWKVYQDLDMASLPLIIKMTEAGIGVDLNYMRRLSEEFEWRKGELELEIWDHVGHSFNPASTDQTAVVVFEELGLPHGRLTEGGKKSTDDEVLIPLRSSHPVITPLLEWRGLDKMKDAYLDPIALRAAPSRSGGILPRIHCDWGGMTVTSRLEARDPNLMAIPARTSYGRRVRSSFRAEPGWVILEGDYSQIEMRVMSHMSQDQKMMGIFHSGLDIHTMTTAIMFKIPVSEVDPDGPQRYVAKRVGFGVIFDISAEGLFDQMREHEAADWTLEDCAGYLKWYLNEFDGVGRYQSRQRSTVKRTGEIRDMFGRRRLIPEVYSARYRIRRDAERYAINNPVQMSAQGVIKTAMGKVNQLINDGEGGWKWARPILQVHDSLVLEVREEAMDEVAVALKKAMEGAVTLSVPVLVDLKWGVSMGESVKWRGPGLGVKEAVKV